MKDLAVHILWLLLSTSAAPVPTVSLPGSCWDAGFRDCCNSTIGFCHALPTFCLCDPSCHMHGDCCDDIGTICTPDYLKPPPPTFLLSVNITYHTATLLWSVPSEAAINDTYTVLYWGLHSPDSVLVYNDNVHSDIDQMLQASISGLVSGVLYQWSIEATNSMASAQSTIANFTTASYARLEGFQLHVYNTSAVLVSWSPPQLPFGVQLKTYIVYYTQTTPEPGSPHSLGSSSSGVGNTTMAENYGMVGGLYSNARYLFWVEAIVLELEGSLQTTGVVTARNATIFVPDSTIVQIRGGPFKACHSWSLETELQVLEVFRRVIHHTVYGDRDTNLLNQQGGSIQTDLVLCEGSGGGDGGTDSSTESRAVYRATLYSTPNHTVQLISSLIEELIVAGDLSHDATLSDLQIDTACPVSLRMGSEPLCSEPNDAKPNEDCLKPDPGDKIQQTDSLQMSQNCSCEEAAVVTLPVLVTAMAAELILIVSFILLVVTVVMVVRRRKRVEGLSSQAVAPTEPNVYA